MLRQHRLVDLLRAPKDIVRIDHKDRDRQDGIDDARPRNHFDELMGLRAISTDAIVRRRAQQLRQLGDVGRDPPRLIERHQLGRRSPAGFLLVIDEGELLAVGVLDDEVRWPFLDGPGRRETALRSHLRA
jgi:hypothetical protein